MRSECNKSTSECERFAIIKGGESQLFVLKLEHAADKHKQSRHYLHSIWVIWLTGRLTNLAHSTSEIINRDN